MSDMNEVAEAIRHAFGDEDYTLNLVDVVKDIPRRDNEDGSYTHIVDVIEQVTDSAKRIADAITPSSASPGQCPSGDGVVGSLTESVMGLTRAMMRIASAIESVATAIENR